MLIEQHKNTGAVSVDKLSDAMFAMLKARIMCHEGRVLHAMVIYDGIVPNVTPDTLLSARRK
jgi:hypothetical protein